MNIDREIAEKVMGWELIRSWLHNEALYMVDDKTTHVQIPAHWHPSTDIKQAFEVVEKMIDEHHMDIDICNTPNGWAACFLHNDYWEYADTPEMAICLAALKAVEA